MPAITSSYLNLEVPSLVTWQPEREKAQQVEYRVHRTYLTWIMDKTSAQCAPGDRLASPVNAHRPSQASHEASSASQRAPVDSVDRRCRGVTAGLPRPPIGLTTPARCIADTLNTLLEATTHGSRTRDLPLAASASRQQYSSRIALPALPLHGDAWRFKSPEKLRRSLRSPTTFPNIKPIVVGGAAVSGRLRMVACRPTHLGTTKKLDASNSLGLAENKTPNSPSGGGRGESANTRSQRLIHGGIDATANPNSTASEPLVPTNGFSSLGLGLLV